MDDQWLIMLGSVICLAAAGSGYVHLLRNRMELLPGVPDDVDAVYSPNTVPRLHDMLLQDNRLIVFLVGRTADGMASHESFALNLRDGFHTYHATCRNIICHRTVVMRIGFFPNSPRIRYRIVDCNIPLAGHASMHSVGYWSAGYYEQDDPALVQSARNRLGKDAPFAESDDTFTRIAKLIRHLRGELRHAWNLPSNDMFYASGLQSFEMARLGESGVLCTNAARIFAAHANLAGIPTRIVSTVGQFHGVELSAHTFCECYVYEQGRWMMVDITQGHAGFTTLDGRVLGAWDVFQLYGADPESFTARVEILDAHEEANRPDRIFNIREFFNHHAKFVFLRSVHESPDRFRRLLADVLQPKSVLCLNPKPLFGRHLMKRVFLGIMVWSVILFVLAFFV